jgi:hypothetical protein
VAYIKSSEQANWDDALRARGNEQPEGAGEALIPEDIASVLLPKEVLEKSELTPKGRLFQKNVLVAPRVGSAWFENDWAVRVDDYVVLLFHSK